MIQRDLSLLVALIAGMVLLFWLTRPLEQLTKADYADEAREAGVVQPAPPSAFRTIPAESSILLGRPSEPVLVPEAWESHLASLSPSVLAVEGWAESENSRTARVKHTCGLYIGRRGEFIAPASLLDTGRALRVRGEDGQVRAADVLAMERRDGLFLGRVRGVNSVPIKWPGAAPIRSFTRVAVLERRSSGLDAVGMGWMVMSQAKVLWGDTTGRDLPNGHFWGASFPLLPGAPLVQVNGELIGIVDEAASTTEDRKIRPVIRAQTLQRVSQYLLQGQRDPGVYLGLTVQEVAPEMSAGRGVNESRGVLVANVEPGSPSEAGGLLAGDVVVKAADFELTGVSDWAAVVRRLPMDREISLLIRRGGETKTLQVQPGTYPLDERLPRPPPELPADHSVLQSLIVQESNRGLRVRSFMGHWVLTDFTPEEGDGILEINGQPVRRMADFTAMVRETAGQVSVTLRLERGSERRYLVLKRP